MKVREIVVDYLKANGFAGVCCPGCGCGVDRLAPCGSDAFLDCVPAYKKRCDGKACPSFDVCDIYGDSGSDCYCYTPTKPPTMERSEGWAK